MYICLWSNWFRKNLHNGMSSHCIYLYMKHSILNFHYSNASKGFSSQTGPNSATKENWGVNYRALNDLFDISQSRRSSLKYEMAVQMVEIYNEQVRDLLSNDGSQKKYPFYMVKYTSNIWTVSVWFADDLILSHNAAFGVFGFVHLHYLLFTFKFMFSLSVIPLLMSFIRI